MKLERYTEERERLDKAYERLGKLAESLKAADLEAALAENRKQLAEDSFKIVVAGEFSRGKSTFVNALIRQALLPMDVLPETALLQVVEYAPETSVELVYKDGRCEPIAADRESLERFSIDGAEAHRLPVLPAEEEHHPD